MELEKGNEGGRSYPLFLLPNGLGEIIEKECLGPRGGSGQLADRVTREAKLSLLCVPPLHKFLSTFLNYLPCD